MTAIPTSATGGFNQPRENAQLRRDPTRGARTRPLLRRNYCPGAFARWRAVADPHWSPGSRQRPSRRPHRHLAAQATTTRIDRSAAPHRKLRCRHTWRLGRRTAPRPVSRRTRAEEPATILPCVGISSQRNELLSKAYLAVGIVKISIWCDNEEARQVLRTRQKAPKFNDAPPSSGLGESVGSASLIPHAVHRIEL